MKKIPAFPVTRYTSNIAGVQELATDDGMTLLDYFAAKAFNSILSNEYYVKTMIDGGREIAEIDVKISDINNIIASASYDYAEAMLEEREKRENR